MFKGPLSTLEAKSRVGGESQLEAITVTKEVVIGPGTALDKEG